MQNVNVLFEVNEICGENKGGITKWEYAVIYEKLFHVDLGEYYTYGIRVEADCMRTFHDITTLRERAEEIAELFNRYQLSPTHFQEAVEDQMP